MKRIGTAGGIRYGLKGNRKRSLEIKSDRQVGDQANFCFLLKSGLSEISI